jgi:hypothetical protein
MNRPVRPFYLDALSCKLVKLLSSNLYRGIHRGFLLYGTFKLLYRIKQLSLRKKRAILFFSNPSPGIIGISSFPELYCCLILLVHIHQESRDFCRLIQTYEKDAGCLRVKGARMPGFLGSKHALHLRYRLSRSHIERLVQVNYCVHNSS